MTADDAALAAALFAVDPVGLGGVCLRSPPGPARDAWLAAARDLLPGHPFRRIPAGVSEDRLLGGLDLAATLSSERPVAERGLLAEADGGVIVVAMAERLEPLAAAHICAALDCGEAVFERDGLAARTPTRFGVVALDEGLGADEAAPGRLKERLAFHAGLDAQDLGEVAAPSPDAVAAARSRVSGVAVSNGVVEAVCECAAALGVDSARAPILAIRAAKAAAALAGRDAVTDEDAAIAARLVIGPRATRFPAPETEPDDAPPPEPDRPENEDEDREPGVGAGTLRDMIVAAAVAALPADVLAALADPQSRNSKTASRGRSGAAKKSRSRGRPAGVRSGDPRNGARLSLIDTLRAAAPWQRLRRADGSPSRASFPLNGPRILVRRDDFRVVRFKDRTDTTTIFVVDASGSSALHRLAEAKGAVELILAESYKRRDRVALVAFRGTAAELLLPPSRSLTRARRSMAGLPGGGGTPLASGIEMGGELADASRRKGETATLVLLTDGRANIGRDGAPGRAKAEADARAAARSIRAAAVAAILIDTSPRPDPQAARVAAEMGARYMPLPHASAEAVARAAMADRKRD